MYEMHGVFLLQTMFANKYNTSRCCTLAQVFSCSLLCNEAHP